MTPGYEPYTSCNFILLYGTLPERKHRRSQKTELLSPGSLHHHFEPFLAVCIGTRKGQMQLRSGDDLDSEYESKEIFRIIASNTTTSRQLNDFFFLDLWDFCKVK